MMGWKIKVDYDLNRKRHNNLNSSGKKRFEKKKYHKQLRQLLKKEHNYRRNSSTYCLYSQK